MALSLRGVPLGTPRSCFGMRPSCSLSMALLPWAGSLSTRRRRKNEGQGARFALPLASLAHLH